MQFENSGDRHLADQLMQPALIRIIDNVRKHLEGSDWRGRYQETQLWPDNVDPSQIQQVKDLQAKLDDATPEQADDLHQALASLPQPFPGYELSLTQGGEEYVVNVWELCYHVCFKRFPMSEGPLAIDTSLIDQEQSDVDWLALDQKAKAIVDRVFKQLGA